MWSMFFFLFPFFLLMIQGSRGGRVLPFGGVRERGSFGRGIGGVRGGRGGGGGRQAGESGGGGGLGAVRRRGRLPLGLEAAAAGALQRGAGRPGAARQRRRGGAGQRRRPHGVAQDAGAHQELPGAVGRRGGSARARRSDVVRR